MEDKILISEFKILRSIDFIGRKISNELPNDVTPLFLGVLNGAFMFTSELVKHMRKDVYIDFIRVNSYVSNNNQTEPKITLFPKISLKDKYIYIVEDIVDTGTTIEFLKEFLIEEGAKDVKVVSLIKRESDDRNLIDYYALEIGDEWIYGYGLDDNELKRNYRNIYKI